jgi:hypothetical protein
VTRFPGIKAGPKSALMARGNSGSPTANTDAIGRSSLCSPGRTLTATMPTEAVTTADTAATKALRRPFSVMVAFS